MRSRSISSAQTVKAVITGVAICVAVLAMPSGRASAAPLVCENIFAGRSAPLELFYDQVFIEVTIENARTREKQVVRSRLNEGSLQSLYDLSVRAKVQPYVVANWVNEYLKERRYDRQTVYENGYKPAAAPISVNLAVARFVRGL